MSTIDTAEMALDAVHHAQRNGSCNLKTDHLSDAEFATLKTDLASLCSTHNTYDDHDEYVGYDWCVSIGSNRE